LATSAGDESALKPAPGATSLLEWVWTTVPVSPVTFTYTLNVPAGVTSAVDLVALVTIGQSGGTVPIMAQPDPLVVSPAATYHSADTDGNRQLNILELMRVIELYNTRNGTTRTGAYAVATAPTVDGFAPEPTRAAGAAAVLARYHSSDYNRLGQIDILELMRAIELYNFRNGTTRTGQYHVQLGTVDGFAPGP
jgi:hypothetical protein